MWSLLIIEYFKHIRNCDSDSYSLQRHVISFYPEKLTRNENIFLKEINILLKSKIFVAKILWYREIISLIFEKCDNGYLLYLLAI